MPGSEAGSHGSAHGGGPWGSPAASGMTDNPPAATTDAASHQATRYEVCAAAGRAATVHKVIATASRRIRGSRSKRAVLHLRTVANGCSRGASLVPLRFDATATTMQ